MPTPKECFSSPAERSPATAAPAAIAGAVRLLTDADPKTIAACRRHLLRGGAAAREALECAAEAQDPRLRVRARHILRTFDVQDWFVALRAVDLSAMDVLDAALLASAPARAFQPLTEGADPHISIRAFVEAEGERLAAVCRGRTAATCARLLKERLADTLGFNGSHGAYVSLSDVAVDQVFDNRRGMPIALSVLYLAVGRAAGLDMHGVALPDHFLVRIHGVRPILLDPFHGGRTVTKQDCHRYLRVAGFEPAGRDTLRDLSDEEMIGHVLRAMLHVFDKRRDGDVCRALTRALMRFETV